jgi:hypothetical protein
MAKAKNTTRNSRKSAKATPLPVLPAAPNGWTIKSVPRGKGAVLLDAALLRLWAILRQQLDIEYSHWRKMKALKAPLEQELRASVVSKLGDERRWARSEKIRAAFERTPAGKRAAREYEAYNAACKIAHKAARAMLLKKPKTVAGAAVFSIAALYENDHAGYGFQMDGTAASRIVLALSRAGGLRLPISVRQMVS